MPYYRIYTFPKEGIDQDMLEKISEKSKGYRYSEEEGLVEIYDPSIKLVEMLSKKLNVIPKSEEKWL
jgi:hypothetical protein